MKLVEIHTSKYCYTEAMAYLMSLYKHSEFMQYCWANVRLFEHHRVVII